MRKVISALVAFMVSGANAQSFGPQDQLPSWAAKKWQTLASRESLTISTRINPFVWRGDFDGDGRQDLAILAKQTGSDKEGIVLLLKSGKSYRLGTGKSFGNGGDDFSWIDLWYVEDRGTTQNSYYEKPVRLTADGLIVAKEGSASALIYLDRGKAKWQQQGD